MTIPVSRTIVRNVFLVCITSRGMNRSVRGLGEKGSSNIMESLTLRIEWSTLIFHTVEPS